MSGSANESALTQSIRKILLEIWDPVGIRSFVKSDYDSIRDEYDRYIEVIEDIINRNGSLEEMKVFLSQAEKEQVPGIRHSDRNSNAAKLLCDLQRRPRAASC
jgi:hypothetical protein